MEFILANALYIIAGLTLLNLLIIMILIIKVKRIKCRLGCVQRILDMLMFKRMFADLESLTRATNKPQQTPKTNAKEVKKDEAPVKVKVPKQTPTK